MFIRNDKLDKKRKEVNDYIKKQCLTNHLFFIDDENINLGMLNKSGLHLNENGMVKRLVNNFCFSMTKWSFLGINECSNAFKSVKAHMLQNPENVIIGYLNVNSLRNKITAVENLMRHIVDVFFLKRN